MKNNDLQIFKMCDLVTFDIHIYILMKATFRGQTFP